MGRVFALDSPIMNGLGKLADLIWLNILVAICCIPIFTIGASLTALHYVVLKIVKNEEGYITKSFFKSFKQNFKQATLTWLIMLSVVLLLTADFMIFRFSDIAFAEWFQIALVAVAVLFLLATMHLFPLLSRYENNIRTTYKNSLLVGILHLPKTVIMMLCWIIPVAIIIFVPRLLPVAFLLGISGPAFLNALLYKKSFQQLEPETEEKSDEEWTVAENSEEEIKEEETTQTVD